MSALLEGLNQEQLKVASAGVHEHILVTAGPGTGKTHTLIMRLAHLIRAEELAPGEEVLVLSFSRAAVREIRQRLANESGDVRYVRPFTFDAFASSLLRTWDPEGDWNRLHFDDRIRYASKFIATRPGVQEELRNYRHVLIDEVQDLVEPRLEFIQNILRYSKSGFTLFGDPAQAIYTFNLEMEEKLESVDRLYKWLRTEYASSLREIGLEQNYRSLTAAAKKALRFGELLRYGHTDYSDVLYQLDTLVMSLPSLGTIERASARLRSFEGSTAILCRSNRQAVFLSRQLHDLGIDHSLQKRARERPLPGWVAMLLRDYPFAKIGRSAFLARAGEMRELLGIQPHEAWSALKRIEGNRSDSLDVANLAGTIRNGFVFDGVTTGSSRDFVISTIHRAKGLEFDRVIIASQNNRRNTGFFEKAEEARVLYVALTRPRKDLFLLPNPETGKLVKEIANRCVVLRSRWDIASIEVWADDVDAETPAGLTSDFRRSPSEIQTYLETSVRVGDKVVFLRKPSGDLILKHKGVAVGRASKAFASTIARLESEYRKSIKEIQELRVEGLESVAGTAADTEQFGLGTTGFWLKLRVSGLADLYIEK